MRDRESVDESLGPLSAAERQSLLDTLDRIAGRLDADEPLCAYMIRMAKDALAQPPLALERDDRVLN